MSIDRTARDVAQVVLDSTGRALQDNDFEAFEPWFFLPQVTESFDGQRILKTRQDLRDLFDGVQAHFQKIGLTELFRYIVAARYRDAKTIDVTHESRLLCHGHQLKTAPYPVFGTLRLKQGRWQIVHCQYAIQGDPEHAQLFGGASFDPATDMAARKRA